jgi:hypothetical protein
LHALFGKRTTEKDLHHRHLAGAPLHSAGGPQKPDRGNPGAALRSDPTAGLCPGRGCSGPTPSGDGRLTGEQGE